MPRDDMTEEELLDEFLEDWEILAGSNEDLDYLDDLDADEVLDIDWEDLEELPIPIDRIGTDWDSQPESVWLDENWHDSDGAPLSVEELLEQHGYTLEEFLDRNGGVLPEEISEVLDTIEGWEEL